MNQFLTITNIMRLFVASILLIGLTNPVRAEGEVTLVTTSIQPASSLEYIGSDSNTYRWGVGNNLLIESFVYSGEVYSYETLADRIVVRRVDNAQSSGTPCSLFAETSGTSFSYNASYPDTGSADGNCDLEKVMSGRIINRGVLDLFLNTGTAAKNVERVDFIFTAGITAPSDVGLLDKMGHVVTEKAGNNPTKIAAITALDTLGNPSAYAPMVRVETFGCTDPDICYGITNIVALNEFLTNSSTPPHGYAVYVGENTEALGMAMVSLANLGIQTNQKYYGFSYFAPDVNETIHTLTDPTTFPTNTNTTDGDADFFGGTAGYFTLQEDKPPEVDGIQTGLNGYGIGSTGGLFLFSLFILALYRRGNQSGFKQFFSLLPLSFVFYIGVMNTAHAENSPSERDFNQRLYLGANLGLSQLRPNVLCPCNTLGEDNDVAASVFVGYDLSKHWSVEGYLANLGDAVINRTSDDLRLGDINYKALGVSAIGYFYNQYKSEEASNGYDDEGYFLRESWSLFGRLGIGRLKNSSALNVENLNENQFHLGLGAEYGWANGIAFRAEVISYDKDFKLASIGILKRFGETSPHQPPAPNQQPIANDDRGITTRKDQAVLISVLRNDNDPDSDELHVTILTAPANGSVVIDNKGVISYTPTDGFTGNDSFVYQINDGHDGTDSAQVTLNVKAPAIIKPPAVAAAPVVMPALAVKAANNVATSFEFPVIRFDFDKSYTSKQAINKLNQLAKLLQANPSLKIEIRGHTDSIGSMSYNQALSVRRATSARKYLLYKGVAPEQLMIMGYGETRPIADNSTKEGRALNRRTDFSQQD